MLSVIRRKFFTGKTLSESRVIYIYFSSLAVACVAGARLNPDRRARAKSVTRVSSLSHASYSRSGRRAPATQGTLAVGIGLSKSRVAICSGCFFRRRPTKTKSKPLSDRQG